jgi:hypothetical protein
MEKTMPKGLKHLDLNVDILPEEGDFEVLVSAGDIQLLQADVEEASTTINILGAPVLTIPGDLTALLAPLDALEMQLESLKHKDLKNLEFNFDWNGPADTTAELQLFIDNPGQQEDLTLLEATIMATDDQSTIDIGGEDNPGIEVTLTGVNLSPLFPVLEAVDLLV